MGIKYLNVTNEELREYCNILKNARKQYIDGNPIGNETENYILAEDLKIPNLRDFILQKRDVTNDKGRVYYVDLGEVEPREGERFDLGGADLSGVRLTGNTKRFGIEWNFQGFEYEAGGKKIIFPTNLENTIISDKCFFDRKTFAYVNFGYKRLLGENFLGCSLDKAHLDPSQDTAFTIRAGDQEFVEYSKSTSVLTFSKYVIEQNKHKYPENAKIIVKYEGGLDHNIIDTPRTQYRPGALGYDMTIAQPKSINCTIEDLEAFKGEIRREHNGNSDRDLSDIRSQKSLHQFIREKYKADNQEIPANQDIILKMPRELSNLNLRNLNLGKCDWSGCIMHNVNFDGSILDESIFDEAKIDSTYTGLGQAIWASFGFASQTKSSFKGSSLIKSSFNAAECMGVNFEGALMDQVKAENAKLLACNFNHANLSKARFLNATLDNSTMNEATAIKANFTNATCRNLYAKKANLACATLVNANLIHADLTGADLSYIYAPRASFENGSITNSTVEGAFLPVNFVNTDATQLDGRNFDISSCRHNRPDWFNRGTLYDSSFGNGIASPKWMQMKVELAEKDQIKGAAFRFLHNKILAPIDRMFFGNRRPLSTGLKIISDLAYNYKTTLTCVLGVPALTFAGLAVASLLGVGLATSIIASGGLSLVVIAAAAAIGLYVAVKVTGAGKDSQELIDAKLERDKYNGDLHQQNRGRSRVSPAHEASVAIEAPTPSPAQPQRNWAANMVSRVYTSFSQNIKDRRTQENTQQNQHE